MGLLTFGAQGGRPSRSGSWPALLLAPKVCACADTVMAGSSPVPSDDADDRSSSSASKPTPTMVSHFRPPSDSASTGAGSSAQEPPAVPASLLHLLLGFSLLRTQGLLEHDVVCSPANGSQPGAAHLKFFSAAASENLSGAAASENLSGAADPWRSAPSDTSDTQPSAVNPWHTTVGPSLNGSQPVAANPRRTPLPMKLFLLLQEPPAAPTTLLRLLLGLSFLRMQWLHPPAAMPSSANENQASAASPQRPTASNDSQPGAINPPCPAAPSVPAANVIQPGASSPQRPSARLMKLMTLVSFGGMTPEVCEGRTHDPTLHPHQQLSLGIPLMALIRKIRHVWSLLASWATISYAITVSGHGAGIFSTLSNRFAEGGFTARLCSYVLSWFGYRRHPFSRVAEFIGLISSLFRHASSTLKSAADILKEVNEFGAINGAQSRISQESATSTEESNEATPQGKSGIIVEDRDSRGGQPGPEHKIVSSISEGNLVIAQWKEGKYQFSVDVPPNMSTCTAEALKTNFKAAGANHLLQGTIINSILEKALATAKSVADNAAKKFEALKQLCQPLSSSDLNKDK